MINETINKEYLDKWIKNLVLEGKLKDMYNRYGESNKNVIKQFEYNINLVKDSKDKETKQLILLYKALIEYIENNENLPQEYKCLNK
jgi:hypothetical protein